MSKPKPEETRTKVRLYRDGMHLIQEFYIDPGHKVIDVDLYFTFPERYPEITAHMNYPAQKVKEE